MYKSLLFAAILSVLLMSAQGGVHYDAGNGILWATDFDREIPCTPERLWLADQMHGWGIVTHEASNDTYTVKAELHIGTDDGLDTYFQIGDTNHLKPAVIMAKDLALMNGKKGKETIVSRNVLSIGSRQDSAIAPVLRFAPGRGLYCSQVPAEKQPKDPLGRTFTGGNPGADVEIYNTLITCSLPDNKFGKCWLRGNTVVLKDTRILRLSESVYIHSQGKQPVTENVVFEDCDTGIDHFYGWKGTLVKGCVFRNCKTALRNPKDVIFKDCRFENNGQNWKIEDTEKVGFIDCLFGSPQKESEISIGELARNQKWASTVEISSSVTVEVKDSRGNPVANARVSARDVQNKMQQDTFSDKAGKAILVLVEKKIVGTQDVQKPAVKQYSYALSVTADKFKTGVIPSIDLNDKSIPVVLTALE